jgi:hypothetical protein
MSMTYLVLDQNFFSMLSQYVSTTKKSTTCDKDKLLLTNPIKRTSRSIRQNEEESDGDFAERLEMNKERRIELQTFSNNLFKVYEEKYLPLNPKIESRANMTDLLGFINNTRLPTITKNHIAENIHQRLKYFIITKLGKYFPKQLKSSQLNQYSDRCIQSILYGYDFPWDYIGLENYNNIILKDDRCKLEKEILKELSNKSKNNYSQHPANKSMNVSTPGILKGKIQELTNSKKKCYINKRKN